MGRRVEDYFVSIIMVLSFSVIFLFPSIVFAEGIPDIDGLLESISSKNYPLIVAFSLSILVWLFRRITPEKLIDVKMLPYVILILAIISGSATGIIMFVENGDTWWYGMIKGLLEGLSAGLMSMGFWSSGLKKVLKVESPKEDNV